jgi:hypothetical protein
MWRWRSDYPSSNRRRKRTILCSKRSMIPPPHGASSSPGHGKLDLLTTSSTQVSTIHVSVQMDAPKIGLTVLTDHLRDSGPSISSNFCRRGQLFFLFDPSSRTTSLLSSSFRLFFECVWQPRKPHPNRGWLPHHGQRPRTFNTAAVAEREGVWNYRCFFFVCLCVKLCASACGFIVNAVVTCRGCRCALSRADG